MLDDDGALLLDAEVVASEAGAYAARADRAAAARPGDAVAARLRAAVEDFKALLPLIEALANPALRARHWRRALELLGAADELAGGGGAEGGDGGGGEDGGYSGGSGGDGGGGGDGDGAAAGLAPFTVRDLLQFGALERLADLEALGARAAAEAALEAELAAAAAGWAAARLRVVGGGGDDSGGAGPTESVGDQEEQPGGGERLTLGGGEGLDGADDGGQADFLRRASGSGSEASGISGGTGGGGGGGFDDGGDGDHAAAARGRGRGAGEALGAEELAARLDAEFARVRGMRARAAGAPHLAPRIAALEAALGGARRFLRDWVACALLQRRVAPVFAAAAAPRPCLVAAEPGDECDTKSLATTAAPLPQPSADAAVLFDEADAMWRALLEAAAAAPEVVALAADADRAAAARAAAGLFARAEAALARDGLLDGPSLAAALPRAIWARLAGRFTDGSTSSSSSGGGSGRLDCRRSVWPPAVGPDCGA